MGGWMLSSGNVTDFESQLERFKRTFTVPGVPPLHVEVRHFEEATVRVVLWSWSSPPVPDITVASDSRTVLLLDGYITGLGRFKSLEHADSGIARRLLELWHQVGTDLIPELNGSFSAVFVDHHSGQLTLVTDRFASRSVWFSRQGDNWYTANFPAAITALLPQRPHLNLAGVWSLFAYSRHVGRHGIYDGFENMLAGEIAVLNGHRAPRISHWYQMHYRPDKNVACRERGAEIDQGHRLSAKRLEASTPEPYLFLSGGLDSRLVAGAMGSRLNTVTLTSHPNMNSRISARVAKRVKTRHQTIVRTPYWYLDTMEAAALVAGGNYSCQHAHFVVPVQQIANSSSDRAFLLGDLLENFNKHYFRQIENRRLSFVPEQLPNVFSQLYGHRTYAHFSPNLLKHVFREGLAEQLQARWRRALIEFAHSVDGVSDEPRDQLDALVRWRNCSCFPTYLMLECISPLANQRNLMFDNDLFNLYLRTPADLRGADRLHRWTLWYLDKALGLIPNSNSWLPPMAPRSLQTATTKVRPLIGKLRRWAISIHQKKPVVKTEGSSHMLHEWYRKDPRHVAFIENCLNDEEALPSEIFDRRGIRNSWHLFLQGDLKRCFEIDMLVSFGVLHRKIPTSGFSE